MKPFLFSFFVAASCVSFAQDLPTPICSSSSSSTSVIIEDIHPSKQSFSFDHESKKITALNSVRTLKINETQGKLETVTYFLSTTARGSYDYNPQTNPYQLTYGPVENNTLPFEVNFKQDPTIYVRTSGILKNQNTVCGSIIEGLDCVNPTYMVLNTAQQQQNPQTVEELTTYFNKPKPSRQKKGNVLQAVSYFYDSQSKQWKSYRQDVFNLSNDEKGVIGENVLDCLMLKFGWKRLNGKCGSNNGIDGVYEKEDVIIAAEVKLHNKSPKLDSITGVHLKPKFNISEEGAITKINQEVKSKILKAYQEKKLYLLPFSFLKNGSYYCKLNRAEELPLSSLLPKPLFEMDLFEKSLISLVKAETRDEQIGPMSDVLKNLSDVMKVPLDGLKDLIQASFKHLDKQPLAVQEEQLEIIEEKTSSLEKSLVVEEKLTLEETAQKKSLNESTVTFDVKDLNLFLDKMIEKGYSYKAIGGIFRLKSFSKRELDNLKIPTHSKRDDRWQQIVSHFEENNVDMNEFLTS